ncbi:hypothetical protein L6R50_03370 [Myxococcota bacterium]|nr:hypothetical protein [Myxococcota bacterium]
MDRQRLPVASLLVPVVWVASAATSTAWAVHDGGSWQAIELATVPGGIDGLPGTGLTHRMDAAGDVDGDGFGDLLVADEERLRLVKGSADGVAAWWDLDALGEGFDGPCTSEHYARRGLGDVSGDGAPDFLLGCGGRGHYTQGIYLYFGPEGGPVGLSEEYQHQVHSLDDEWFGKLVSPRLDFDGDGQEDLVAAGTYDVRIYPGPVDFQRRLVISRRAAMVLQGVKVEALDGGLDFDGDGVHDLAVGEPSFAESALGGGFGGGLGGGFGGGGAAAGGCESGRALVVPGFELPEGTRGASYRSLAANASLTVTGLDCGERVGARISLIGDLDGDGLSELAVLSPGDAEAGRAARLALFYGSPDLAGEVAFADADAVITVPAADADQEITAFTGRVDLDADGLADLVVGQGERSDFGASAGIAWMVPGSATRLTGALAIEDAPVFFLPEEAEGRAGSGLAWAGDVDGDGFGDLLLGAPARDAVEGEEAPPVAGRVYVVGSVDFKTTLTDWPEPPPTEDPPADDDTDPPFNVVKNPDGIFGSGTGSDDDDETPRIAHTDLTL